MFTKLKENMVPVLSPDNVIILGSFSSLIYGFDINNPYARTYVTE